jgi:hypothetical protein
MNDTDVLSSLPPLAVDIDAIPHTSRTKQRKRKHQKSDQHDVENNYQGSDIDLAASPEAPKILAKKKRKGPTKAASRDLVLEMGTTKGQKAKEPSSPSATPKRAQIKDSSPPSRLGKNQACLRCKEKKIKCNQAKPACNQCLRGLWMCQYQQPPVKKTRSINGRVTC